MCCWPLPSSQVQCIKVTSTDTDLYYSCKFLAVLIGDLACVDFISEVCSFLLLCNVEFTFVNTVCYYRVTKLFTCKVVKNHTFLSGVDHCAIV